MIDLITDPMSNPLAIANSFEASTLLSILLHLVDDQWMIFALLRLSWPYRLPIEPCISHRLEE